MKHIVELTEDIERRLAKRAAESGQDVGDLIHFAVRQFVDEEVSTKVNGTWSDELESRRLALIDKEIAGTISNAEQRELAQLDRVANEHFDRIAPPPIEGARRLHEELQRKRGHRN
jgi:hypothetical protein